MDISVGGTCESYKPIWWNLLIPSSHEIFQLCRSYDKTYLFSIVIIRFLIFFLLFKFLVENEVIRYYWATPLQYYGFMFSLALIIFYALAVMNTWIKRTKFMKVEDNYIYPNLQRDVKILQNY